MCQVSSIESCPIIKTATTSLKNTIFSSISADKSRKNPPAGQKESFRQPATGKLIRPPFSVFFLLDKRCPANKLCRADTTLYDRASTIAMAVRVL
jgi:hypothetical protein